VFPVPIVIACFLVFVVAAFVRRTVAAFVVAVMASGVVRLLGSVRTVAVWGIRASAVATLGEHGCGQYEGQQQNEDDPHRFHRRTPARD